MNISLTFFSSRESRVQGVPLGLSKGRNRAVLQSRREAGRATSLPARRLDVAGLEWHILSVVIQQEVVQSRRGVVGIGGRSLARALIPDVARNTLPSAKDAVRSDLLVNLVGSLVLEEAGIGARCAQVLELLVDERSVR